METSKCDFDFRLCGFRLYEVTYTSPVTGKVWAAKVSDMELIDATKNADTPKNRDLEHLKRVVKRGIIKKGRKI